VIEDELGFKVVKDPGAHDEFLALAANLPIARRAFDARPNKDALRQSRMTQLRH